MTICLIVSTSVVRRLNRPTASFHSVENNSTSLVCASIEFPKIYLFLETPRKPYCHIAASKSKTYFLLPESRTFCFLLLAIEGWMFYFFFILFFFFAQKSMSRSSSVNGYGGQIKTAMMMAIFRQRKRMGKID